MVAFISQSFNNIMKDLSSNTIEGIEKHAKPLSNIIDILGQNGVTSNATVTSQIKFAKDLTGAFGVAKIYSNFVKDMREETSRSNIHWISQAFLFISKTSETILFFGKDYAIMGKVSSMIGIVGGFKGLKDASGAFGLAFAIVEVVRVYRRDSSLDLKTGLGVVENAGKIALAFFGGNIPALAKCDIGKQPRYTYLLLFVNTLGLVRFYMPSKPPKDTEFAGAIMMAPLAVHG